LLDGVQLSLLIGPAQLPVPAPLPLIEALQRVEVTSSRERSGFQLTFSLGKTSPLQTALVAGLLDPITTRVVVTVVFRGMPHVLIDGIVTRHELSPSNEAGKSTLTLTGDDLHVLMDILQVKAMYPAVPIAAQVMAIMAKYAMFGVVPMALPVPLPGLKRPTDRTDTQTGTDYQYVKGLATQCGYIFRLEPGPLPGQSTAYFGPDLPLPIPQRSLAVNCDQDSNVESFSASLDGLAKRVMVMFVLDPVTRKIPIPVPVPNISPLHPPLGARLTPPSKLEFSEETSALTLDEATNRAFGFMLQGADAVSANVSVDTARYGQILRPRTVVGVRGAGFAYDGMYYVNSVTHSIKRGEYKQSVQLSRDGVVTQQPAVLP